MSVTGRHIVIALFLCTASPAFAQMTEQDIRTRLDAVYAGMADQVSQELPMLLRRYTHDAGVLYLQAVLTADGALAMKRYQEIGDQYPQSTWADDALYKVYQYYFSLGLYAKADVVLEQLRLRYPQSIYAPRGKSKVLGQDSVTTPQATPQISNSESKSVTAPVAKSQTANSESKSATAPVANSQTANSESKSATAPVAKSQTTNSESKSATAPVANSQTANSESKSATTPKVAPAQTGTQQRDVRGSCYVQVGVFSTEANASREMNDITIKTGRQAVVVTKYSGDKMLYCVRFEGFDSVESARSFSEELRRNYNIDSFVFLIPNSNAQ